MSQRRLRSILLALLVAAGVLSVVGKKADSAVVGWLSFAVFAIAVGVYFSWRRAVRAKVFDREAKTSDETRARPDQ
jgi:hypothetical protein